MATANPPVRIVTDSTCNVPAELLERYHVTVAPIIVLFGQETYRENIDIETQEFYQRIRRTGFVPTTSQPPAGAFAEIYRDLAKEPCKILSIHVTGKLSGTLASAFTAQQLVPEADVTLFDSLSISMGTGFHVMEAARMAEAGAALADIVARLEAVRSRTNLYLTPETLKYLQRSGRLTMLQGALATLLNVKPIIRCLDGTLDAFERVRTRAASLNRLLELTQKAVGSTAPVNVAVIHADARAEADDLARRVRGMVNVQELFVETLSLALGVHGGPGIVGIVSYKI